MNDDKLVSIIIPVYKVEKYLDKCINSVVKQTYKNLEIILVDDGSPDNCPKMCDEWGKKDERIRVIHKKNGGLSSARNSGLNCITGDYVLFVDSDDWIEPDMVSFLYKLIYKNGYDFARCGFFIEREDGSCDSVVNESVIIPSCEELISDLMINGFSGCVTNKMYLKSAIDNIRFNSEDGCSEDFAFNYNLIKTNPKAIIYDIPKYHYLLRKASITNSAFSLGAFDIIKAKEKVINDICNNKKLKRDAIKGYVMSAFVVISGCIQNNSFNKEMNELINNVLNYKFYVLFGKNYSLTDKIKLIILMISPRLYASLIIRKYKK